MTATTCQSCGAVLPEHDSGAVLRCTVCRAPQVRLSEDLWTEALAQRARYEEALVQGGSAAGLATEIKWNKAIALAAIAAAATILLCALLPPLVTVAWLVPPALLLVYRMRFPQSAVTALAGARIGAAFGLLCSVGAAVAGTLYVVALRFGLHRMGGFDALFTGALANAQKQAAAQNGAGASSALLLTPEFRAGMLLLLALLAAVVFVVLCVAGGALAGAMQRRRLAAPAE